uniref:Uncharacterized protein n=1 Tax=Oryza meridionalis TaxID=40149 RepID=A0A0E0E1Y9_9ORYZ
MATEAGMRQELDEGAPAARALVGMDLERVGLEPRRPRLRIPLRHCLQPRRPPSLVPPPSPVAARRHPRLWPPSSKFPSVAHRAKFFDEYKGELGWVHIRQSVHNPNIAINMQSSIPGGCKSMAKDLLDRYLLTSGVNEFVDITEVQKFVK